jgi:hypothetical protein
VPLFHGHPADVGDHGRTSEGGQPQAQEGQKELLYRRRFIHEKIFPLKFPE